MKLFASAQWQCKMTPIITSQSKKKYRHDVYSSIRHRLGFPESTLRVLKSYPPSSDVGDHPKTLSDMILDPRKIIRQNYLDHTGCRLVHNCDKLRQARLGFLESTPQVLKSYPPSSDVGDHPKTLSEMILDPRKIIRQNYLDHTGCRIVHNCDKLRQTRLGFLESTLQVLKSYPPSSDVGDHPKTWSDMILDPRKIIRQNYLDHTGCRIVHNCGKLRQTRLGFPESTLQVLKSYPPSSDAGDRPKTLSDMILDPRKIIRENYLDHTGCRIVHSCDKLRQTRLGFPESPLQVLKSYPPSSDVGDHPKTLSEMILDPRKIIRQNYLDHTGCRIVHNCDKLRQARLGFPESTLRVLKSYPPSSDVGDHPKTLSEMILDPKKIIRQNYLDHIGCRIVHNCDKLRQTRLGFPESTLQN